MYEAFFQMKKRPFSATPDVDAFFPAHAINTARLTSARCVDRAAGPALVLGASGTGKSLLLSKLAHEFSQRFDTVQLTGGRLRTVKSLLQNILFELKLPFRDVGEGELRLTLLDRVEPGKGKSQGLLLLVDEAHVLPGKLLDELRMITNLVRGGEPRVRLVLAGDVRLEERLANPRLASFQQRVAARCYLHAFTKDETSGYVRHQLNHSSAKSDLFSNDALSTLHRLTDGVPRLINQLCDHALMLSATAGNKSVTAEQIEIAWADLQQLPSPQTAAKTQPAATSSVIEFGTLDDLPALGEHVNHFDAAAPVRHDPLLQLEAIERQIAEANEDEFDSLTLHSAEFEPSFASSPEPFGDSFDEEEVLIDRYASLEARTLQNRPRVSSSEGRAIATLMGTASSTVQPLGIVADEGVADSFTMGLDDEAFEDPFDPASDPVMPEYHPSVPTNVVAESTSPELVVIDMGGETQQPQAVEPQGRVHRQEYRQLFARLRKGG